MRDTDTSKPASTDRFPGRFLNDGANVLPKPSTDICNLLISLNKFPNAFKLAKVKPIFKKGRKIIVSNYRLISLLQILSKVIEKVVHKQTTKFSNDHNIFCKYQSGFRNNHSTELFLSFPKGSRNSDNMNILSFFFIFLLSFNFLRKRKNDHFP